MRDVKSSVNIYLANYNDITACSSIPKGSASMLAIIIGLSL